ncbi:MAG: efflux RND transporter periplasmic adaptor subunit [Bacteroidales bacterium]|jgi:RND family efflux transporter MFP subunit
MLFKLLNKIKTAAFYVLFLILVFLTVTCRHPETGSAPTDRISVKVTRPEKIKISFPIRTSGTLSSKSEMKLSFKTGGIIDKIYADEGQTVKKGRVLAKLNLSEIEAHLNQARLAEEKAERDLMRARNLYNDSVATLEELQNAQTALEIARSNLRIAQFNRKYSVIEAPSDGKILKKLAEDNEIVGAGSPLFLFASEEGDWVLRVALADVNVVKINLADSAKIQFDAFPGIVYKSVVSEIATASDPYTGTYEVELRLTEAQPDFVNGLIGKAVIIPSVKHEYIVLPVHNIHEANGMTGYVYLVKGFGFEKRKVEIMHISDSLVFLGTGIHMNDSVIAEGAGFLEHEMKIEIID